MSRYRYPLVFVYFCSFLAFIQTVELTFELADNDKQCFYEELKTDSTFVLEFQVNRLDFVLFFFLHQCPSIDSLRSLVVVIKMLMFN